MHRGVLARRVLPALHARGDLVVRGRGCARRLGQCLGGQTAGPAQRRRVISRRSPGRSLSVGVADSSLPPGLRAKRGAKVRGNATGRNKQLWRLQVATAIPPINHPHGKRANQPSNQGGNRRFPPRSAAEHDSLRRELCPDGESREHGVAGARSAAVDQPTPLRQRRPRAAASHGLHGTQARKARPCRAQRLPMGRLSQPPHSQAAIPAPQARKLPCPASRSATTARRDPIYRRAALPPRRRTPTNTPHRFSRERERGFFQKSRLSQRPSPKIVLLVYTPLHCSPT